MITCVLFYSNSPDIAYCDWVTNYQKTKEKVTDFDVNLNHKELLIWDNNFINYISLAIDKSDNPNKQLICTHSSLIDTSIIHPASLPQLRLISTHSVLYQVLRRSREIGFKVNFPKEILLSFTPNLSYEGSFLRYIHHFNIKNIKLSSISTP